jgi:hypothetical protein
MSSRRCNRRAETNWIAAPRLADADQASTQDPAATGRASSNACYVPLTMTAGKPRLVGRSSSLFTRVVRVFAVEAAVECTFEVVPDLMSSNSADYADNPALKLPTLVAADGTWFGSLNICRALVRASERKLRIVWPESLLLPLLANAQELTSQAMATEVTLIMAGPACSTCWRGSMPTFPQRLLHYPLSAT